MGSKGRKCYMMGTVSWASHRGWTVFIYLSYFLFGLFNAGV